MVTKITSSSQRIPLDACRKCDATDKKLSLCSRCRIEKYCSRTCQIAVWPKHKKICVRVPKPAEKAVSLEQAKKCLSEIEDADLNVLIKTLHAFPSASSWITHLKEKAVFLLQVKRLCGSSKMQDEDLDKILKILVAIPSAEREFFIQCALLLIIPETRSYPKLRIVEAMERIPAKERGAVAQCVVEVISPYAAFSWIENIINIFANDIPNNQRNDAVRLILQITSPQIPEEHIKVIVVFVARITKFCSLAEMTSEHRKLIIQRMRKITSAFIISDQRVNELVRSFAGAIGKVEPVEPEAPWVTICRLICQNAFA